MHTKSDETRRVKFYGTGDYATYWQAPRAFSILEDLDPDADLESVNDVLELCNSVKYVDLDVFPKDISADRRAAVKEIARSARRVVAIYFGRLSDANLSDLIKDLHFEYRKDLLDQLARFKVYGRCTPTAMFDVLDASHFSMGDYLESKELVRAYDAELRSKFISEPGNAEHIVRKHVEAESGAINLPASLSADDLRDMINAYIGSAAPNPNIVQLVSTARIDNSIGIDKKTKLAAKRRHKELVDSFFKENSGIKTGCEVSIVDGQADPFVVALNGMVASFSYSRQWLEANLENATILNNFIHLFEIADQRMLLTLPAYPADIGTLEGLIGTQGKETYRRGSTFRLVDQQSFLTVAMYSNFLAGHDVSLEEVIAWFFADYLVEEFGASGLRFMPSSSSATYLERSRHLFSEMESIAKQFSLFVECGELDTELMSISSGPLRYGEIPSLVEGKYAYATANEEIKNVLHLLFSDQSHLTYINANVNARSLFELLRDNVIAYEDFADHQRPGLDYLANLDILRFDNKRVSFVSRSQVLLLEQLFRTEVISCLNQANGSLDLIESMVERAWLARESALLSAPEVSYFNFYLNQAQFSDGPDLRNSYLHGSQADTSNESAHSRTYIIALRMIIALVLKINDDFCSRRTS